ncbi:unnamed protein product [Ixodes pacificus]
MPQRKKGPPRTSKQFCCVPFCSSARWKGRTTSFHMFPSEVRDATRRREWIWKLKIGKNVTPTMAVCSNHFTKDDFFFPAAECKTRRLKLTAVPSQNLPESSTFNAEKAARSRERNIKRLARRNNRSHRENHDPCIDCITAQDDSFSSKEREVAAVLAEMSAARQGQNTVSTEDQSVQVICGGFSGKFSSLLTEDNVNTFTGLPSLDVLDALVSCYEEMHKLTNKHQLSAKDRVVMTMMKLKHSV